MLYVLGLWQALRNAFPGAQLKGCVFHWTQAVMRKVTELGMKTNYEKRQGDHAFIRKLLALPFLPGEHIRRAFGRLNEKVGGGSAPMASLFQYVEDQWMSSSLWSCQEWSVYRQTVRSNNDVEGKYDTNFDKLLKYYSNGC